MGFGINEKTSREISDIIHNKLVNINCHKRDERYLNCCLYALTLANISHKRTITFRVTVLSRLKQININMCKLIMYNNNLALYIIYTCPILSLPYEERMKLGLI